MRSIPYQFSGVTAAGAAGQYARAAGLDGTSQLPHIAPRPMSQGPMMTSFYGHPSLVSPVPMSPADGLHHPGLLQPMPVEFENGLPPQYQPPASVDDFRNLYPPPLASVPSQPAESQFGHGRRPETPATPQSSVGSKWLESAVASELASNSALPEGQLKWHTPLSADGMAPTLTTQTSTESSTPPSEQSQPSELHPHHIHHEPPKTSVPSERPLQENAIRPLDAEDNGHWNTKAEGGIGAAEGMKVLTEIRCGSRSYVLTCSHSEP